MINLNKTRLAVYIYFLIVLTLIFGLSFTVQGGKITGNFVFEIGSFVNNMVSFSLILILSGFLFALAFSLFVIRHAKEARGAVPEKSMKGISMIVAALLIGSFISLDAYHSGHDGDEKITGAVVGMEKISGEVTFSSSETSNVDSASSQQVGIIINGPESSSEDKIIEDEYTQFLKDMYRNYLDEFEKTPESLPPERLAYSKIDENSDYYAISESGKGDLRLVYIPNGKGIVVVQNSDGSFESHDIMTGKIVDYNIPQKLAELSRQSSDNNVPDFFYERSNSQNSGNSGKVDAQVSSSELVWFTDFNGRTVFGKPGEEIGYYDEKRKYISIYIPKDSGTRELIQRANGGDSEAQYLLGKRILFVDDDLRKMIIPKEGTYNPSTVQATAYALLSEAMKNGNQDAVSTLAWMNKEILTDYDTALRLYQKVATNDNPKERITVGEALVEIADMYEKGLGVPVDKKLAIDYYIKAGDNTVDSGMIAQKIQGILDSEESAAFTILKPSFSLLNPSGWNDRNELSIAVGQDKSMEFTIIDTLGSNDIVYDKEKIGTIETDGTVRWEDTGKADEFKRDNLKLVKILEDGVVTQERLNSIFNDNENGADVVIKSTELKDYYNQRLAEKNAGIDISPLPDNLVALSAGTDTSPTIPGFEYRNELWYFSFFDPNKQTVTIKTGTNVDKYTVDTKHWTAVNSEGNKVELFGDNGLTSQGFEILKNAGYFTKTEVMLGNDPVFVGQEGKLYHSTKIPVRNLDGTTTMVAVPKQTQAALSNTRDIVKAWISGSYVRNPLGFETKTAKGVFVYLNARDGTIYRTKYVGDNLVLVDDSGTELRIEHIQNAKVTASAEQEAAQKTSSEKDLVMKNAQYLVDKMLHMLLDDEVNKWIEEMCTEKEKASSPTAIPDHNPGPPSSFSAPSGELPGPCSFSSLTTLTAQAKRAVIQGGFAFQTSWTITACKENVQYIIYLANTLQDRVGIASGTANKGNVTAEAKQFSYSRDYAQICIQASDLSIGNNGYACFNVV